MSLPISHTEEPADCAAVSAAVRGAAASGTAVYPVGGGTSLNYGLVAKRNGIGLSLKQMTRIVDYPARDMTITVESGITMSALAQTLAAERQQLPLDVPQPDRATLGGVIATNFNGPRRFGQGSVRDHVIGIEAVDGRGVVFHGGGRVVKNVAGYDFCKLLTGSFGTLAVITQVTLKVKPLPEKSSFVVGVVRDLDEAERLVATLGRSDVTPMAVELLGGPAWRDLATKLSANADAMLLAVGFEGTAVEVDWMVQRLASEWHGLGVAASVALHDEDVRQLWRQLAAFPASAESPLVVKFSVVPSGVQHCVTALRETDAAVSIQAHAGNGVVIGRLSKFPAEGLARTLVGRWQAVATASRGNVTILSNPSGAEMTSQGVWGRVSTLDVMTAVKRQFDPHGILNPGRFVFPS